MSEISMGNLQFIDSYLTDTGSLAQAISPCDIDAVIQHLHDAWKHDAIVFTLESPR